jgi:hypothetical protein
LTKLGLVKIFRKGMPITNHIQLNVEKIEQLLNNEQLSQNANELSKSDNRINKVLNNSSNEENFSFRKIAAKPRSFKKLKLKQKENSSKGKIKPLLKKKETVDLSKLNLNSLKLKKIVLPSKKKDKTVDKKESLSVNPKKREPVPVKRHKYTRDDYQLYESLLRLGAMKHNEEKNSYALSMNTIHELLSPSFRNPYNHSKIISDKYKAKTWTQDEVIDVFKFYMEKSDKRKYKNIKDFICVNPFVRNSFSPLVMAHQEKEKSDPNNMNGDDKVLFKELASLNIAKNFDYVDIKNIITLIDLYTNGLKVNHSLSHMYFDNPIYAFSEFIQEQSRNVHFEPYWVKSEKFVERFVSEFTQRGVLIHGSTH